MERIDTVFQVKDHAEQIEVAEMLVAFYSHLLQHEVKNESEAKGETP